jgi:hypothetical protein
MGDASTQYQARAEIDAQMDLAHRLPSNAKPGLAAFAPIACYLGIAALVTVGAAMNVTSAVAPSPKAINAVAQLPAP